MAKKTSLSELDLSRLSKVVETWEKLGRSKARLKPAEILRWFDVAEAERRGQAIKLGLLLSAAARIGLLVGGWRIYAVRDVAKSGHFYVLRRPDEPPPNVRGRERRAAEAAAAKDPPAAVAGPLRSGRLVCELELVSNTLDPTFSDAEPFRELIYEITFPHFPKRRWRFDVKMRESAAENFAKCREIVLTEAERRISDLLLEEAQARGESLPADRITVDFQRSLPRGVREGNT